MKGVRDDGATRKEVRVVSVSSLDVRAHAALQQRVFGALLEENGIPLARLGPEVFAWKLRPPAGEARVALVERDGAILSTCTALPIALGSRERAWHLCDAATAPEARGQGLFGRVLSTLCAALPPEDWLFAFPNEQSRPAFARRGFTRRMKVPLRFRPARGSAERSARVTPIEAFGAVHDALAERIAAGLGRTAARTPAYLRWRYDAHPYFDYQRFELRRDGVVDGLLVLNRMKARGRVSLWLMELLAVDGAAERELARAAVAFAKAQGCDALLAARSAKVPGTMRVPPCFLPKQHVLMVRGAGDVAREPGHWHVETGDWDTF